MGKSIRSKSKKKWRAVKREEWGKDDKERDTKLALQQQAIAEANKPAPPETNQMAIDDSKTLAKISKIQGGVMKKGKWDKKRELSKRRRPGRVKMGKFLKSKTIGKAELSKVRARSRSRRAAARA
eukprot:TRINITY_DN5432_c0_g1_i2.p1 TRINITY_DN5432_c0_g1~~TRINITY_DN5432_c0_g1_i2.p1  ORF type:complete len:125 (+),score=16.75 TRINITY_DN5432_c0_g1_i2:161-535(+)